MDDTLFLQSSVCPASWPLSLGRAFVPVWHPASVSIPGPFVLCCLLLCCVCQRGDPRRAGSFAPCFQAGSCQQDLCSLWRLLRAPLLPCCTYLGSGAPQGKRDSCKMYHLNLRRMCMCVCMYLFIYLRCSNWVPLGTCNVTKSGQCFHGAEGMSVKLGSSSAFMEILGL